MILNCAFKCHSPAQKLSYFVRSLLNLALYELLPSVYFSVFRAAYERPHVCLLSTAYCMRNFGAISN